MIAVMFKLDDNHYRNLSHRPKAKSRFRTSKQTVYRWQILIFTENEIFFLIRLKDTTGKNVGKFLDPTTHLWQVVSKTRVI